jgi:hypothetical protein
MKTCGKKNCNNKHYSKGICKKHYDDARYKRNKANKNYRKSKKKSKDMKRRCAIKECNQPHNANGWCSTHCAYIRRNGQSSLNKHKKQCSINHCNGKHYAKNFCLSHYEENKKLKDKVCHVKERRKKSKECGGVVRSNGYCSKHYARWITTGSVTLKSSKKGSGCINSNGYRVLCIDGKDGVLEHRYVMEQHLGRKLLHEENIHHKNGNRSDNRLSNLEIWNTKQPSGQRVPDKVLYAKEILTLYSTEKEISKLLEEIKNKKL